jgi:hypothetical protein
VDDPGDLPRITADAVRSANAAKHLRRGGGICRACGARRVDRQLGSEATPEEYVANLAQVFREVWRVLRDDGVLWLNLGDSYASKPQVGPADGWLHAPELRQLPALRSRVAPARAEEDRGRPPEPVHRARGRWGMNQARRRMIATGVRRTLAYLLALQDGDDARALSDAELRLVQQAHGPLRDLAVSLDPPPVIRHTRPARAGGAR